jgi:hypothetical protein
MVLLKPSLSKTFLFPPQKQKRKVGCPTKGEKKNTKYKSPSEAYIGFS